MASDGTDDAIRIGVSACLLGQPVRFDGGHKRNAFLVSQLAAFVEFVPVCPEVEAGMDTPRPTLRLQRERGSVRMVEVRSGRDHTRRMERFASRRVRALRQLDLCGYVLKKDSPSCGMERVKVYPDGGGAARREGVGLFAEALLRAQPLLPVEEEGRLSDPALRENFIERVFAFRRLKSLFRGRWSLAGLVAFHTAHKMQLLAHSPGDYRALGRLVANARRRPRRELRSRYQEGFMRALARTATRGRNTNVLQHMAGHLADLDAASRAELAQLVEEYRLGRVPLVVPLTLIRHHVRRLGVAYLSGQAYLDPHPKELMLRNHV